MAQPESKFQMRTIASKVPGMLANVIPALLAVTLLGACATDRSNAIMKNRILATSPGNQMRMCPSGYVLTCKSTQEHVEQCYCLDRDVLRDVIPPDPARMGSN